MDRLLQRMRNEAMKGKRKMNKKRGARKSKTKNKRKEEERWGEEKK
jgi:hypothetical protein